MRTQKTISRDVYFEGFGLHTGVFCRVALRPAPVDTGIVFHRIDRNVKFTANLGSVMDTAFATTVGTERGRIRTVEHLLASLSAMNIDNAVIEVEGPEVPILDGSAMEIISLIDEAGIKKQGKKMPFIKILKPIFYEDSHASVALYPYEGRKVSFRLFFKNHFLGEQKLSMDITHDTFFKDVAPARTFGFVKDIEYFKSHGLAKGGSLQNAVMFSDTSVVNETGLRFKDECVRHKILDLVGDFSLMGLPIEGHIVADKSGHTTNIKFLSTVLAATECWQVVTDEITAPAAFSFSYS
jgi:UDP-3-O-[3-hydroxymyristoyl] N-acetylglucosamine deacetylase